MSIILWVLAASSILISSAGSVLRHAGLRVSLIAAFLIGLTPISFIRDPAIPVFLPELLLASLAGVLLLRFWPNLHRARLPIFLLVYAMFFTAQVAAAFVQSQISLFDFVRDVRPLLFLGGALAISALADQVTVRRVLSERLVATALMLCVATDILFYVAAYSGAISPGGISGEFYERTGIIRYADLMTLSVFGVANYFVFYSPDRRASWIWLLIAGAVAATSLNRIFWVAFLIALSCWFSRVMRAWSGSAALGIVAAVVPAGLLISGLVGLVHAQPDGGEMLYRAAELLSPELLLLSLEHRFVDPAMIGGYQLSPYTLLFGEGVGFRFFIPWFEYRGLDPWHFSVDSLFAFSFFKYGLVGMTVLVVAVSKLLWGRPWSLANVWIWLYLIVHSGINVPGFMYFMLVLVLISKTTWILSDGRHRTFVPEQANEVLR